ncbi:MAG: hypothetical protein EOP50_00220 [Sphingobacteriales bacterium]|nr:MAG: hypothetical protein EOP50_00220 [Sphingobacteriales bacterium]
MLKNDPLMILPISIILTVVLVGLKLLGYLHASWFNVFFPLEAMLYMFALILVIKPRKKIA